MNQQSGNDELNSMGYASSAPDFVKLAPATNTKPQDEVDLPALLMVSRLLAARKAKYESIKSFTLGDISLDNQLIINNQMVFHIEELQNLVDTTIQRVKEKLSQ